MCEMMTFRNYENTYDLNNNCFFCYNLVVVFKQIVHKVLSNRLQTRKGICYVYYAIIALTVNLFHIDYYFNS